MNRPPLVFRPRPLAAALALALAAPALSAQVLPGGLQVVAGQASVQTQGTQMTVTNSANAILNWRSFSIGPQSSVRFQQPDAASRVLNRVTGNDPSAIFGSLSSNGQVWLLNPNGVLFGAGARIDVAGLVASTLSLPDADFLAGRARFSLAPGADADARLVNQGEIRTASGGRVALLSGPGGAENSGLVEAAGGQVLLAAGREIELVDTHAPNLALRVAAPAGQALNLGQVLAPGGRIDVQAAIVNQQGVLRADALAAGPAGTVELRASQALTLAAGSHTGADGAAGGTVTLDAGAAGTALVAGEVSARGSAGHGGALTLLGRQVGVLDGGVLDASGRDGGGSVHVGGGLQGRDASLRNAEAAFIAPGATLAADATGRGAGGEVVVWSDRATRAYGRFSARGGADGGDGGLVETSGGWLDARPAAVDVQAVRGLAGTWLIDPNDITISDFVSDGNVTGNPNFTTTNDGATISSFSIQTALNNGNSVTVTTANGGTGSEAGDITLSSATLTLAPNLRVGLTLNAARNIVVSGSTITNTGQPLDLTLNAAQGGAGAITVNGGSSIRTNGGNITLAGGGQAVGTNGSSPTGYAVAADTSALGGVFISSATLDAGAGAIVARGATAQLSPTSTGGVYVAGSTLTAGDITLSGWSDGGIVRNGVVVSSSTLTATHSIALDGTAFGGSSAGGSPSPTQPSLVAGITVSDSFLRVLPPSADPTASLVLTGRATITGAASSGGTVAGYGINVQRTSTGSTTATLQADNAASVQLDGTLSSPDAAGYALALISADDYGGLLLNASGADSVTMAGHGSRALVGLLGAAVSTPTGGSVDVSSDGDIFVTSGGGSGTTPTTIGGSASRVTLRAAQSINFFGGQISTPGAAVDLIADGTALLLAGAANVSGGTVRLLAPAVQLQDSAQVTGNGSGDAVIVAGGTAASTTSFTNTSSASALNAPSGRWLVFAQTPESGFAPGALVHDFRQYGLRYGADRSVDGVGNGFVFALAPTLVVTGGGGASKVYDGSTSISIDPATLTVASGLVAGDSLATGRGGLLGLLDDAHVGTGKAITLSSGAVAAVDASGKPVFGYTIGGLTGSVTPRPVTGPAVLASDKVYDGNVVTRATLVGASLGVVEGETLNFSAEGRFADADAGSGKPVTVTTTLADGLGRASDYQLVNPVATTTAAITPKSLALTATVADKVYDGTTAASVTLGGLDGLVTGESLNITTRGVFSDPNAGGPRSVVVQIGATDGTGKVSNYSLPPALSAAASITQATLTYVADPASVLVGGVLPTLGGSVTGFVAGENLSLATSGTPTWTTVEGATSAVGRYAITGGGLAAANYRFEQAAANATALSVVPLAPPPEVSVPLEQAAPEAMARAAAVLPQVAAIPSPLTDRALDVTQALVPGEALRFRSVPVGDMSQEALAALLASRDRLKQNLFADALAALARDPRAADAKACETPQQAESGTCLITDAQRDALRAAREAGAAPSPQAAATPGPSAPATPAAPAASPAPAAAPAPAPAVAAATPPLRPPPPLFAGRATVRSAALPQIQRKVAVLIGADRYQDARIPQLDNAVGDARAVARLLESALGYETVLVENGSKAAVLGTLNRLATEIGPNDSVVVYYAGHGAVVPSTGEGYWQPSDADATNPATWISNADIGRAVERLGASQVALISDSCYSGTLVSDARIRATAAALDPAQVLSRRTAVVMSSGGNEPVFDAGKDGHSTFAWNLMRALQQVPTWQPGGNVFERVRFAVARELPQRPQYGAFGLGGSPAGIASGSDYLFEKRQITR